MAQNTVSAEAAFRALTNGRFPQTVLLSGEAGCGKRALAQRLAAALLCTGAGAKPCGKCNACHKAAEGIHPDLTIVDEGDGDIKVDRARALRAEITIRPNDGDRRVVLLHHAHRMNPMAQTALLTTLEEPPAYAFFILTSEKPGTLLPTILSRCTKYELAPAEAAAPDEALLPLVRPVVGALSMGDEVSLLRAAMALEKQPRPTQRAALLLLQTALRDALFCAAALPGRLLPELAADTGALARRVSPERLLRLTGLLCTLASRLDVNAAGAATSSALAAGAYAICFTNETERAATRAAPTK